ncbi:NACHT domain-containing protein [Kitasatospora sp. NPDC002227]|uniref:NACHT domain-containing protein n=1 Tax=Kitasatospora sp. NPDC002227 TaxID=3154773 RepID=UPI00332695F5
MITAQRVVAVRAHLQGSGFLLTPRLVLTAAHPLGEATTGEVAALGGLGWKPFTVVGRDEELDVALLRTGEDVVGRDTAFDGLHWTRLDALEPVNDCHLTGFPQAGRDGGRLDSFQAIGTLTPGSTVGRRRHLLALRQRPPMSSGASSPWVGLSGAALFRGEHFLGVVVQDHRTDVWGSSQLLVVPAARILTSPPMAAALTANLGTVPRAERISAADIADLAFEREYAESIRADYGRIRIFGLRQSNRRGWELDTAYLSLEASRRDLGSGRVEQMLAGRRRVLLRGHAGSGKTTLVQWLAVHAAAGTMSPELAELNHRVPLVLQLRKLYRQGVMQPRPEQFLELDDRLCADRQPDGWVHRMLSSGRALLLVDGLDEVPAAQREEALEWLERLLGHYPKLWTLATVRPSAVPEGWLEHLDFTELSLRPMNDEDRRHFVARWHAAALAEVAGHSPEEAERSRRETGRDQADLLRALERSPELNQLADSPLLCAMLCALNRDSDGVLPRRRMELYRDALSMMLVKRDETRRIEGPEQLRLSEEEQLAVLSRLAHWLVRNNWVEGSRADAVRHIDKAMGDLPSVARQGSAEQVYRHLVNRTGLLAEPSNETFQFIHRTFQDYLAAMEFEEERDFGLLADRAHDEQWADVIRLTVGHCGRGDRARLLGELVRRAAAERNDYITLLAGTCLPYAPEIDARTREVVLDGVERIWNSEQWRERSFLFALVGEEMIPILGPGLRAKGRVQRWVAFDTAAEVGGEAALRLLAESAEWEKESPAVIAHQWSYFDSEEFAERVLTRLDLAEADLVISDPAQLAELHRFDRVWGLHLHGDRLADTDCWAPAAGLTGNLWLRGISGLTDLSALTGWQLDHLHLSDCPGVTDLSPLAGAGIEKLTLRRMPGVDPEGIAGLAELAQLELTGGDLEGWPTAVLSRSVATVSVTDILPGFPVGRLPALFPNLRRLVVDGRPEDVTGLDGLGPVQVEFTA